MRTLDQKRLGIVIGSMVCAVSLYKVFKALKKLGNEDHHHDSTRFPSRELRKQESLPLEFFLNKHNLFIHWRKWIPASTIKGMVVIIHGFGEHCARYEHIAQLLITKGYIVYSLDHQGHGRSEGDRAYVKKHQDYLDDIHQLVTIAKAEHQSGLPMFLLGHSMGGNLALSFAIQQPQLWKGVILSAPGITGDPKVATPFMVFLANLLSNIFPKLELDQLPIDTLCGNHHIVDHYVNDPLNYYGGVRARFAVEFLKTFEDLPKHYHKITWPYLLLHGDRDEVVQIQGSKDFHEATNSKDKTFIVYRGYHHEIFNEADAKEKSIKDVLDWLEQRCP